MRTETEPKASERRGDVGSVVNAVEILRVVSGSSAPIGVSELARRVGLHKSSVSRIVSTLERANLLTRDERTNRLSAGLGLLALAVPVMADLSISDVIRPAINQLAVESGETSSFNIWDRDCAVSVIQAAGSNAVQVFSVPGYRNPTHATAAGKALLAQQNSAFIQEFLRAPLERFTPSTITACAELMEDLRMVRERGYAVNVGEYEHDVGAVAAPVFGSRGTVVGCITVTVPIYRLSAERIDELGKLVVSSSKNVSKQLEIFSNFQK